MKQSFDRRGFLKGTAAAGASIGMLGFGGSLSAAALADGTPHAEKLGWHLGCQAWSFNHFTFFEAIDKTASLGLLYIEAYPGQKVSKTITKGMDPGLPANDRKAVKQKLADSGLKLVNFGVTGANRSTFDFAKDMGIETIVSEPGEGDFDNLDKLCEEYAINIAIHDHPKPSHYWNPDTVLKVTKGRSKRIGACCDVGHWVRSGLDPVECLKKLEGRIISFHFKDLNKRTADGHDVAWGTGASNVKAILTEVHRQGVKAVFSVEFEYHMEDNIKEIAESVKYFDKVASEIQS